MQGRGLGTLCPALPKASRPEARLRAVGQQHRQRQRLECSFRRTFPLPALRWRAGLRRCVRCCIVSMRCPAAPTLLKWLAQVYLLRRRRASNLHCQQHYLASCSCLMEKHARTPAAPHMWEAAGAETTSACVRVGSHVLIQSHCTCASIQEAAATCQLQHMAPAPAWHSCRMSASAKHCSSLLRARPIHGSDSAPCGYIVCPSVSSSTRRSQQACRFGQPCPRLSTTGRHHTHLARVTRGLR